MSSNSTNNSLDATLDVLSHSTRRYVLRHLDSEPGAVPVESLAAAVAAWQVGDGRTDDERSESDSDARRRAHVSLRHVHLPRLESAGLIERTRESETEYVEATLDGTPVSAFFDAGLLGEFAESDRP